MSSDLLARLTRNPLIAILRGESADSLEATIDTLITAGIEILEVTLTTPGAAAAITGARLRHPRAFIGAGTVLTAAGVQAADDAGAQFLVSPDTNVEVLAAATRAALPALPGAFSATEILLAWRNGAMAVKVFPARSLGPGYITDVHAPLPEIPLIAVGGVGLTDVRAYLDAGVIAVGIGSPLLGDALAGGSQTELKLRARAFLAAAKAA